MKINYSIVLFLKKDAECMSRLGYGFYDIRRLRTTQLSRVEDFMLYMEI